jgi:hypothetical protein
MADTFYNEPVKWLLDRIIESKYHNEDEAVQQFCSKLLDDWDKYRFMKDEEHDGTI